MDAQKEQKLREAFEYLKERGFYTQYDNFEIWRDRKKKPPPKTLQLILKNVKKAEEEYREGKTIPLEEIIAKEKPISEMGQKCPKTETVEVPIIGKIVEDKILGNKVIYFKKKKVAKKKLFEDELEGEEKEKFLKAFGSSEE